MDILLSRQAIMPDIIKVGFISPSLSADSKQSLIFELVALAESTGFLLDKDAFQRELLVRESDGSTAAKGCAMLHQRIPKPNIVSYPFIVLGRTLEPVNFGALDGLNVDLCFALGCQDQTTYTRMLNRLARMTIKTGLLSKLRLAPDSDSMYQCIITCEQEILK